MLDIRSLEQARKEFSTQQKCEDYLARKRWPNGVTCPRCGRKHQHHMPKYRKWYCKWCDYQYSVTAHTIFHATKLPLTKWMVVVWLLSHSPKGCSAKQIERTLGVHYETAWSMAHRIRRAMAKDAYMQDLAGVVEIDDAVVKADGGVSVGNTPPNTKNVLGFVSRDTGTLRFVVVETLQKKHIRHVVARNLGQVRELVTDATNHYKFLGDIAPHSHVAHYISYSVDGVHTNFIENAWSLFKRGLTGLYHHVSAKHLQAYLDEFAFRYSHRHNKGALMDLVLANCQSPRISATPA